MRTKKDKLIKKRTHKSNYIIVLIRDTYAKLKFMHERIKQLSPEDLKNASPSNPYQMLSNWLTDNLTFGTLSTITINALIGWQGWYNIGLIIGLSLCRHLVPEIIKLISESVKGK